ncbi:MAG: DNA polymerase III subunit alpha, partial [Patescibacteria group bacterium]|nr:DNA polymerase III subunit alpha [Patescibacteria group bacterium]
MTFIHLHVHSHFSLLDGLSSPEDIAKIAKEQGAPAIALTDHGNMYGSWLFYEACQKEGIKPIIGCEVYVAKESRHRKDPALDKNQFHLILLAQNYKGYQNLMKLVSIGFLEGFYYKPRIDWEVLEKYSDNLICSTACVQGELPQAILQDKSDKDIDLLVEKFKKTFLNRFFLEVMPHEFADQKKVNSKLYELAEKHNLDVIATCDAHYPKKEDEKIADILARIQTATTINEEAKIDITEFDLYLRAEKEMLKAFPDHPEVVENTNKIAEMINVEMPHFGWIFPKVELPKKYKDLDEYLRTETYYGIEKRLDRKPNKEEKERIEYELDIIKSKGFSSYFLTVREITNYMQEHQIQTTTRGSAAGSLVSYALGITRANPLFFELPFERFLNPLRPKAPDIDIDIADDRRDELIKWTINRYGADKVAQIVTFGTMAAKASFKDTARVFEIPFSETNEIAKLMPVKYGKTDLQKAIEEVDELSRLYKKDEKYHRIFDIALRLEGKPRHASVHAAGIVITPEPINNYVPLSRDPRADTPVTQFDFRVLEEIGLMKMDYLGVRNLSILADCRRIVKKRKGLDIDPEKISLDDKKTFELLGNAETFGVFQLESAGMRRYLKDLKPTSIFDISAMVALYRPGPMENIPEYISRKHGHKPSNPPHPRLKKILEKSLGMIVYQDDVLLTAIELAGYDWGEVDKFRKAIGKKIPALMAAQHDKFVDGCIKHSELKKPDAENLFKLFAPFASYGFNKAHAAAYSMLAYQTAYFKANYAIEYMAALLRAEAHDPEKTTANMEECERMG